MAIRTSARGVTAQLAPTRQALLANTTTARRPHVARAGRKLLPKR